MHGDELESLLKRYSSGIENVVLQGGESATIGSSSLIDDLGQWFVDGGETDGSASFVKRMASGVPTMSGGLESPSLYDSQHTATSLGATKSVLGEVNVAKSLGGGDGIAGKLAAMFGGNVVSSGLSALLSMFNGSKADDAWDGYQPNHYTWEVPSHVSEGLTSTISRISTIDTRYDGSPRSVESKEVSTNRIDVRIEALDARSFLDRKEDIAEAVRQAMLTSGVIGSPFNEY